ncbi:BamA/TamA family outer membrane protein [Marivirga sp.]|uniref:BamA/TamA family outer membrane protein n=1 Tax=Marivirga sp. TaxID=2018662 RepID=UPI002D7E182A|nr:BamA/TamA family outer membrane protein [Marivirga sp.]HET8859731.1 BamA/TamA family outer membrane protein [Marivirga sp.]
MRGNKKTKKKIITREIDLQPNVSYPFKELKRIIKLDENKIFNTGLFTSVKAELEYIEGSENKVKIIFFVQERWYIWPSVIFKLADRNFSDWLFNQNAATDRFEYGFKFDQFNVRGLNERLSAMAQFGFKRRFSFGYNIPYLNEDQTFGMGLNFSFSEFDQLDYTNVENKRLFIDADSIFGDDNQRNIIANMLTSNLIFNYRESYYNTHSIRLTYSRTAIIDDILLFNENYLGRDGDLQQNFIGLTYIFRRDFRDRNNYPLKGFLIDARLNKTGLGIFKDIDQGSLQAQVAYYKPLKYNFNIASSLTGYTSYPRFQPYNNMQGLGFSNNLLKGYELYVIQGQHYTMHKTELKKRLFSIEANLGRLMPLKQFRKVPIAGYFKVYFDQGYVQNNLPESSNTTVNSILSNRYIYSYGAGLDLVTYYDAVLRLEYSINALNEAGFFINVKAGI